MPIYTDDPCNDGATPFGIPLVSSIGINPKVTKAIDAATRDWLDDHPEATTTVEDYSLTNRKFMDGSVNSRVIEDESITTDDIADLAVTTDKIANGSVNAQKVSSDAVDGLRPMSTTRPGVAKVGAGLAMNDGALELNGGSIAPAVTAWLNAHPEATTTVQANSVSDDKLIQNGGVLSEVHDARTTEKGVIYSDIGSAIRSSENALDDIIDSNILYRAKKVSVLESDGSSPTFVYHKVATKYDISSGDVYTLVAGSISGASSANTLQVNLINDGGSTVRSALARSKATITVSENDIENGAVGVTFVLYPAQGTGPLAAAAIFSDVKAYAGDKKSETVVGAVAKAIDKIDVTSKIDKLIVSNALFEADSISVLESDTGSTTYIYHAVHKQEEISAGDVYTFLVDSVTGAGTRPITAYIKDDNNANVRSAEGDLSVTITVTQQDIDNGASYVEFDLYPAKGTGPLSEPAVFTGIGVYAGSEKEEYVGSIINDIINDLYVSNIVYKADNVAVSGSGSFVYKDVAIVTEFEVGDSYTFSFDEFAGASAPRCACINLDNDGGQHVRGVVGSGKVANVTVGESDVAGGATKIVFRLYPAQGTPLPTGTASFDGVIVYKGSTLYEAGDVFKCLISDMAPMLSNTVRSIAHRGDDIYGPECTAAAYKVARKHGHNIAENDVQITNDGVYVMSHDTNFGRLGTYISDTNGYYLYTDGTGFYWYDENNLIVYDQDYRQVGTSVEGMTECAGASYGVMDHDATVEGLPYPVLRNMEYGAYKGFAGEHMLTFEEWVLLCKQLGMEIYIDKKIGYSASDVDSLFATVRNLGMKDKAHWIISSVAEAQMVKAKDPNARLLVLQNPTSELVEAYSQFNTGRGLAFNGNGKEITQTQARLGLESGFEVECWYVDVANLSKNEQLAKIQQLVSYGVSGLTLDHWRVDEAFADMLS